MKPFTSLPHWPHIACFMAMLLAAPSLRAQGVSLIPIRKSLPSMTRFDESTKWSLVVKSDAIIHSPLLRLRDIATPSDPSAAWWDRAGASIIGMMPVNKQEMVVERSRLSEALSRSTAIPDIQWSGADVVRVTFVREPTPNVQATLVATPGNNVDASPIIAKKPAATRSAMTPSERDRVTRLLQIAVDRYDVQLREVFDIEIDPNQSSIDELAELRRVDSLEWELTPVDGINLAKVVGMNPRQAVTAPIEIKFTSRPLVVVAREAFRRGHILSEADLTLMPAGRNLSINDAITQFDEAVGMEVQSALVKDRPITRSAIRSMIIIDRGDLVEVRVVGGGIVIATGAKSLRPGAQGELIPIETLEPRKKMMARVASAGVVEILTRPPQVR